MVKNLPAMCETQVRPLDWEDPLQKEMATDSSTLCLENSIDRGAWQATVSPWGRKESDTTELLTLKHLKGTNDNSF